MVELLAEVFSFFVQSGGFVLGEAGVEVYGRIAFGVESHVDILQPAVVEDGCIVLLIVAPIGLESHDDPSRFLTPRFGSQPPGELGALGDGD